MDNLTGAVAIVTGAAQGLGYAVVKAYAREGMKIAMLDVLADKLDTVAAELRAEGADCLPIPVDLSDAADTERAIQTALAHYGTPRVLIHNAALLVQRSMLEITLEQWQKETNIILQAGFQLCKAVWQPTMHDRSAGVAELPSFAAHREVRGPATRARAAPATADAQSFRR